MPATDPVKALLEALADREGYRLVPKEPEATEMDRLSEVLKAMTPKQLVRVISKLRDYQNGLRYWAAEIEAEYKRRAAEITIVTLPGVRSNTWDPPKIRGLEEEIGFVNSAIRLAEEALADRILQEAAAKVLNLAPDDDPASYLVVDSLVDLVTEAAAEESGDAAA